MAETIKVDEICVKPLVKPSTDYYNLFENKVANEIPVSPGDESSKPKRYRESSPTQLGLFKNENKKDYKKEHLYAEDVLSCNWEKPEDVIVISDDEEDVEALLKKLMES